MLRVAVFVVLALLSALFVIPAGAAPRRDTASARRRVAGEYRPQPSIVRQWEDEKMKAAQKVALGRATPRSNGTVELDKGQWVEYELQGTDHIITVLAEFTDPQAGQIPEPDRSVNNWQYWLPNFNRKHYQDMLFEPGGGSYGRPSMRDFYLELSSGRYTVHGQVSNWVQIDQPESEFGADTPGVDGSDDLNGPVYRVVQAALEATGQGNANIDWSQGDVWDRYDCDADGNFNEPDGYVDHFQVVHAGIGQEGADTGESTDAIWSHRWYANLEEVGTVGPAACPLGGYQVPGQDLWVGDYTIEPEDGGLGVFAHEFAHDLGLPDLYDYAGGENSTEFWTLMSQGSWGDASKGVIGTNPVQMGAWEKFVLGWLDGDLATVNAVGERLDQTVTLGPAEGASAAGAQALMVNLPPYPKTTQLVAPQGQDPRYYYSTTGDNLDVTMRRKFRHPLAAESALTFRTWYEIEADWDYAYVEYSKDDGNTWITADGNLSTETNPNGQNQGHGITGTSGGWVTGNYRIPKGATDIGFRYWTDAAFAERGFIVDSISVGPFRDDGSDQRWKFNGFLRVTNGRYTRSFSHYYLVESRSYVRNDINLKGAYNFITASWLEKEPYADGVLVWYRDTQFADNNVSLHPGHGQVLPVDAHPGARISPVGGDPWRTRWQSWDSAFGLDLNKITLTEADDSGQWISKTYEARPVRVFADDVRGAYYNVAIPESSVITPGSGVTIELLEVSANHTTYRVRVSE